MGSIVGIVVVVIGILASVALHEVGHMLLLQLLPLHRLYTVLRSLGTPKLFIELIELTYRYIFVLEETAEQWRST